ncbi:MAG: phospholipid carrier-dependent glycosyltransferase [Myxococcales bacterium]|nr:MAG: phospholipid carrier-dependent glycosyltransferase [Myxococcales bacterium]
MSDEQAPLTTSWLQRHAFGVAVAVVVLLALAIRARGFGEGGLVHFDEGAYACGGLALATMPFSEAIHQGGLSPIIAPPLTFLCIGFVFRCIAIADWVAVLVPLVAGVVTVGLTAGLARAWFRDTVAAVASAAFLAATAYHVVYSRLVLSDGLLLMLLVAALWAFTRAHASGRVSWYVLAGAITGLCWNTKYHGLLPIVMYLVFLVLHPRYATSASAVAGRRWWKVGVATLIAVVMVIPQAWFVWDDLGLAAFFAHRAGYLSTDELGNAAFAGRCLYRLVPTPILALAVLGVAVAWRRRTDGDRFLLALCVTCVVLSPWYRPYPRLYLPLVFAVVMAAGRGVKWVGEWVGPNRQWVPIGIASLMTAAGAWSAQSVRLDGAGYRLAADRMAELKLLDGPVLLACQDSMRFYLLSRPDFAGQVAPVWAPGFRYSDPRWQGRVVVVVDAVYANDGWLKDFLREGEAKRLAVVANPVPWVVQVNYVEPILADGEIVVYEVSARRSTRLPGEGRGV